MRMAFGPGLLPTDTLIVTIGSPSEARTTGTEYWSQLIQGESPPPMIGRESNAAPPTGRFQGEPPEKTRCGTAPRGAGGGGAGALLLLPPFPFPLALALPLPLPFPPPLPL